MAGENFNVRTRLGFSCRAACKTVLSIRLGNARYDWFPTLLHVQCYTYLDVKKHVIVSE